MFTGFAQYLLKEALLNTAKRLLVLSLLIPAVWIVMAMIITAVVGCSSHNKPFPTVIAPDTYLAMNVK